MRRSTSCSCDRSRALGATFALALLACGGRGPRPSTPATAVTAPEGSPANVSELALRLDHVRRLREAQSAMPLDDERRAELDRQLVDALVGLAAAHRAAAALADPKAASLPPPRDLRERRGAEASARADETETESDAPPPPEPTDLPRDDSAFGALSPVARAHVLAADRCLREAIASLARLYSRAAGSHGRPREIAAREAELLTEIGQLTDARSAWMRVLRPDERDALSAKAWLAFADWFATQKKSKEAATALARAADAAAAANESALLRRSCERARALELDAPPSCATR